MNTVQLRFDFISHDELATFSELHAKLIAIKEEFEKIESEFKAIEAELITRLDAGQIPATPAFHVSIRAIERRFPPWKEHYIKLAGRDATEEILSQTEPKLYRNLVVKAA
ncbi:MAG: hypothetical protein NTV34_11785 [Proteobacteria bacterium]|nr:hypothetical protein [Pseudomonadota bacterium]